VSREYDGGKYTTACLPTPSAAEKNDTLVMVPPTSLALDNVGARLTSCRVHAVASASAVNGT
jgi:hypothetical protein